MVAVSGEAGIGKTTVVEDFLDGIEARYGAVWIGRGRCSERGSEADAFVPVLESLDSLCRGEAGEQIDKLIRSIAPVWRSMLAPGKDRGAAGGTTEGISISHDRMRREFVRFFEEVSRIRPLVLFLDDLHWADTSTCDLLTYAGSRIRNLRVLIVVAVRPAAVIQGKHPFLLLKVDLERRGLCKEVAISLLTLNDVERYLSLQFPSNSFPSEFAQMVYRRTEGNPLFMTDLLRFLQDGQILEKQNDVWCPMRPLSDIGKLIPAGVQSMIRVKIEELSDVQRQILLCGAVQGIQFDTAVTAQVLSLDPVEVEELVQQLETAHSFITGVGEYDFANRALSMRYRFAHIFYQNVLYASLTPTRRAAWSLAIARSLVSLTGESSRAIALDLAMLFETGRDFDMAAQYFLHGARNSASVFAYPEAAILCDRGLAALSTVPVSRERDFRELQFSLVQGLSLMVTRGYAAPEVERAHRRARELCIALNETRRLIPVLWSIHTCEVNAGNLQPALGTAQEMRQAAGGLADPFAKIESLHALGTTLAFMGRLSEARQALEAIFEGDPASRPAFPHSLYVMDPYVTSLSMLARLLALMGCLDQAVAKAAASAELADRLAHPPSQVYAGFWVGWIAHTLGRHSEACQLLESTMSLSRTYGLPQFVEWARVVRGSALTYMDRMAEGVSEIRTSLDRLAAMRALLERPYCLTLLAEALSRQGACEEALALCDEALALGHRTAAAGYEPETHRVRGVVLLSLGRPRSEAEEEFQSALRLAAQNQCRLLELRAAISWFHLGDCPGARTRLAQVAAWFQGSANSPTVSEALSLLNG
jgi:tetratricopeptide (TPR) repeat protein